MSDQSPAARVEGLGSAHSGTAHFVRQRVTAVALVPLAIWFAVSAFRLIGADRDSAFAFLHRPLNSILMALFVIAAVIHMALGIQVVIEDYAHGEGGKLVLLLLNKFFAWLVGAACVFALVKIAV
ncbi:MAG: succinate dehydrogenase, hydrophobic membrane anchor protein [Rhizomicrobium sp.]